MDGLHDNVCQRVLVKVERTSASLVEESVHGGKCLSGTEGVDREGSMRRETAVQTPGEEDWWSGFVEVRESAAVEGHGP